MKFPFVLLSLLLILGCGPQKGTDSSDSSSLCSLTQASETSGFGISVNSPDYLNQLAQSFSFTSSKTLSTVDLALRMVGSPTGVLGVSIQTDGGAKPSGSNFSSSAVGSVNLSNLSASASSSFVRFTLSDTITLSASTTYWIVLQGSLTDSSSDYVEWFGTSSDPLSTGQAMVQAANGSWTVPASGVNTVAAKDFSFKLGCP